MATYRRTRRAKEEHGLSATRLYRVWCGMVQRCQDADHHTFGIYGGRGIEICEEWRDSFCAFASWALTHGYTTRLTIERIDLNGAYCPENCCWIPGEMQAANTRQNRYVTAWGETKHLAAWARDRRCKVSLNTLSYRLDKGLEPERALSLPHGAPTHRKKPGARSSDYLGVCHHGQSGCWEVSVRRKYVGIYKTEEEAARAADRAALETWGPYALLNFPEEHPNPLGIGDIARRLWYKSHPA